jgi:hypothetical protein
LVIDFRPDLRPYTWSGINRSETKYLKDLRGKNMKKALFLLITLASRTMAALTPIGTAKLLLVVLRSLWGVWPTFQGR